MCQRVYGGQRTACRCGFSLSSGGQTQVTRHSGKHSHLLSHLGSPVICFEIDFIIIAVVMCVYGWMGYKYVVCAVAHM